MSTESSSQFSVPPSHLPQSSEAIDPTLNDDPAIAPMAAAETENGSTPASWVQSSASGWTGALVAPEIGEPSESEKAASFINSVVAPTPHASSNPKAVMTRFWVAVIAAGVLALFAVSDWHAKRGAVVPFPNTSRIPRVR